MIDLHNIKNFTIDRPDEGTIFWSAKEFDSLPETHREQILFLDKTASEYIYEFSSAAHLMTGGVWDPFAKGNFKTVEEFSDFSRTEESKQRLKKWLFNRQISFSTWVFVLFNGNDGPMLMTWKMLIKYSDDLFIMDDVMVFDSTLNWCLFFFHEDKIFFGKDNIYDPSEDLIRKWKN
jgi:hypothetical protein